MESIKRQYIWCNCSKDSLTKFKYIKELLLRYSYRFKILFKIIRLILWKYGSWLILYSFGMACNIYTISQCTKKLKFSIKDFFISCGFGHYRTYENWLVMITMKIILKFILVRIIHCCRVILDMNKQTIPGSFIKKTC